MNPIVKWLVTWKLKEVGKMLSGYKTYIAGGLMIITGVLQMSGLAPESFQTGVSGWDLVMAGITTLGIGHKLAKISAPPSS